MTSLHPIPRRDGLAVEGLRKSFGHALVLDGIDLHVPEGTITALLGPNGAGKTTTVNILTTLLAADGGRAEVAGHDVFAEPDAVRAVIGVTGQFAALDDLLSARENLELMARLHRLDRTERRRRVDELLERFDLGDAAAKPASTLSGGMRRRVDVAMTLVGRPTVLFLDEPTTGLDPRSRRSVWELVEGMAAEGVTVLLTSQYLEEADRLADRIAVLDGGTIAAEGTAAELKRKVPGGHIVLRFATAEDLDRASQVLSWSVRDDAALALHLAGGTSIEAMRSTLGTLDERSLAIEELSVDTPGLDDVFLAITDRKEAA